MIKLELFSHDYLNQSSVAIFAKKVVYSIFV